MSGNRAVDVTGMSPKYGKRTAVSFMDMAVLFFENYSLKVSKEAILTFSASAISKKGV